MNRVIPSWLAIRMRSSRTGGAQKAVFAFTCRYHARCAFPLIYFRARDRAPGRRKRPGAESPARTRTWTRRRRRRREREIFDRRRDAAVSFISRQEQDPRRSFRPRTGPSRDVIVALHLSPSRFPRLRCRAGDFFLFHVKTR